jgi:YfiH family protein
MVHAGWLGTVRRAAEAAVKAMVEAFGSSPGDLVAGIGPSIGPDHYEIGEDVHSQFSSSFGPQAEEFFQDKNGRHYLNLWSANQHLLETQGVSKIEVAGLCTSCENVDWFSHRAERGRTGRFAALLSREQG